MKNRLLLIGLLVSLASSLVFSDESGDSKKFPGEFSLSYTDVKGYGVIDNTPSVIDYSFPAAAIYSKSIISGAISFPIKFYTIKPFFKDELIISTNPSNITDVLFRNRFFYGLENIFTIEKVMDIKVNFEGIYYLAIKVIFNVKKTI